MTYRVTYTRSRIGDPPQTILDRTQFDTREDAERFARALTRYDHIINADVSTEDR